MSLAPITPYALETQRRRRRGAANNFTQLLRAGVLIAIVGLGFLAAFIPMPARAATLEGSGSFESFVAGLWPQARARGVSRATFDAAFRGVAPDPSVLAKTRRQAEFVKPVGEYLEKAVSQNRLERGRNRGAEFRTALERIDRKYGVDPYIVLGVWGMETNFGSYSGDNDVVRALATLAHARYRGDFFRKELLTALRILEQRHVSRAAFQGSWAGAMGQTQFMPSSFMAYAVDFDGDGRKNIWTDIPDALASTANYLKKHGWIDGETWGYEVRPPAGFDAAGHGPTNYRDFAHWAREGFVRADREAMPKSGRAALLQPAGPGGPAFLVTPNFKVIKSYINSTSYALGVALLGDRLAGGPGVAARWPSTQRQADAR